jgi:uncharacterized coiled-coil protein SlyX
MLQKPHFSPEINFGHIATIVSFVASITLATFTMRGYFDDRLSAQDQRLALHEYRLDAMDREIAEEKTATAQFRADMRAKFDQMISKLEDVRIQLGPPQPYVSPDRRR